MFYFIINTLQKEQKMLITLTCVIIAISDGDTLTCLDNQKNQHKIRLAEIDAPEKKQEFGTQAKEALSNLVYNKIVTVNYSEKDRYNRIIGYVNKGNTDINYAQIQKGFAWFYETYGRSAVYKQAQSTAQMNKIGLWQGDKIIAPWDFRKGITQYDTVVLNNQKQKIQSTADNIPTGTIQKTYECKPKYCKNITSCQEAYYLLNICGFKKLDGNNDGKPCENVCK